VGFVSIVFLSPFPIVFRWIVVSGSSKSTTDCKNLCLWGRFFPEGADLNWSSIPAPVERRYAMVGNGEFAIADVVILPV
jgi:hypothetical protein